MSPQVRLPILGPAGVAACVAIICASIVNAGQILRVPGVYPTIQTAIDDADEGDVVLVAPGTYREAVKMKAGVDLIGNGPAGTILTAQQTNAVVSGADHCRLDGFTITGHIHEDIDGVYCADVNDFTISNNVIKNCTWSGVNLVRSAAVLRNNVIFGNRCAGVFLSYPAAEPYQHRQQHDLGQRQRSGHHRLARSPGLRPEQHPGGHRLRRGQPGGGPLQRHRQPARRGRQYPGRPAVRRPQRWRLPPPVAGRSLGPYRRSLDRGLHNQSLHRCRRPCVRGGARTRPQRRPNQPGRLRRNRRGEQVVFGQVDSRRRRWRELRPCGDSSPTQTVVWAGRGARRRPRVT